MDETLDFYRRRVMNIESELAEVNETAADHYHEYCKWQEESESLLNSLLKARSELQEYERSLEIK